MTPRRAPRGHRKLQLAIVLSAMMCTMSWVVPQPKANVWRTLARAMGQDHICLSQGSAQDPIASCLVGIPFQESELPPELLQWKEEFNKKPSPDLARKYSIDQPPWWKNPLLLGNQPTGKPQLRKLTVSPFPISNPLSLWRDWISSNVLTISPDEPQELELLGSSPAPFCVQFVFTPSTREAKLFYNLLQVNKAYYAAPWCKQVAHVEMASTLQYKPLTLPRGTFLICGDRAFNGIPSRLLGGPCTLGRLSLLTPNKTTIMDWIVKNSSTHATVQKRDLASLSPDCESDIIHWSKAKATAVTIFLPWVSVAKSLGELGRLECWVAKQANLTSTALADLLQDERVTRQATLQNRAAIDYLLLLHHHTCEEFEGLCCFNLTSKAENVRNSIQKIKDMVHQIQQESKDWFDQIFGNWGLSGWVNSLVKTLVMILVVLLLIGLAFGLIKHFLRKAITKATSALSINQVWASAPPPEEWIEMQQLPLEDSEEGFDSDDYIPETEEEQWPTQQPWLEEIYPPVRWY
ncbi:hypothetical protein HGM15179_009881 [Zosterops borbonicus]|uniref:Envelope glycoprotein n=1 Tax=Zosterops borbonicus TaxID=364589 RepID=A0A8K1LKS2_9PASS|nr:hypothetical protein HGM15179_009881 [Zosterops borbonicus]